jgi:murein DD-endopeptidase MepM/ murein hydrolase activator NlpD
VALAAPVAYNFSDSENDAAVAKVEITETPTLEPTSFFGNSIGVSKPISLKDYKLIPVSLEEATLIDPNKVIEAPTPIPGTTPQPTNDGKLTIVTKIRNPCKTGHFIPTSVFNWQPGMNWRTQGYHPGLDLVCNEHRETLVAIAPAIVWWVKWIELSQQDAIDFWISGMGVNLKFKLQTDTGTYDAFAIYGHVMRNVAVTEGQLLAIGDDVATQGNTGRVITGNSGDGTHLHLGICIMIDGQLFWLNPEDLF